MEQFTSTCEGEGKFSLYPTLGMDCIEIWQEKNIDRQAILCLAVNYDGMTLKEVSQKYGARSYFSVSKAVSRFRQRLVKDHKLQKQFKNILSNVQMWPQDQDPPCYIHRNPLSESKNS